MTPAPRKNEARLPQHKDNNEQKKPRQIAPIENQSGPGHTLPPDRRAVFRPILAEGLKGPLRIIPTHDQSPSFSLRDTFEDALDTLAQQHQAPIQSLLLGARGDHSQRLFHTVENQYHLSIFSATSHCLRRRA